MCGIVGIIGSAPVAPRLVDALKRLEYRGYDSAGVATLEDGAITRRRAEGKLGNLAQKLSFEPLGGNIGIGHTRWATHGAPTEGNAHPHATDRVAVERLEAELLRQVAQLALGPAAGDRPPLQRGDARAVIAAIFEALERIHQPGSNRRAADDANNTAHGYFPLDFLSAAARSKMVLARPGLLVWRLRASASASAGTSSVITLPALTKAPSPTVTGATSALLEPIKA